MTGVFSCTNPCALSGWLHRKQPHCCSNPLYSKTSKKRLVLRSCMSVSMSFAEGNAVVTNLRKGKFVSALIVSQQCFKLATCASLVLRADGDRAWRARNIRWIQSLGWRTLMQKSWLLYRQCSPFPWQPKNNLAYLRRFRSSIRHFTGSGSLTKTFCMYALILSRCFSQKCCTVSFSAKGSKTLTRCGSAPALFAMALVLVCRSTASLGSASISTLPLWRRRCLLGVSTLLLLLLLVVVVLGTLLGRVLVNCWTFERLPALSHTLPLEVLVTAPKITQCKIWQANTHKEKSQYDYLRNNLLITFI